MAKRTLMNTDTPVLTFDDESIELHSEQFLPYCLKDFLATGAKNAHITALRDFLAARTLSMSRTNAKVILNSAMLPQSLKTPERLKIVYACRGVTMTDNFWIKNEGEVLKFSDVCLRKHRLSEISYDIAILGKHVSATAEELSPDLMTEGMFPKYWHRENGTVSLWKTDKTEGQICTKAELEVSDILDTTNASHVRYRKEERDGRIFAVSDCFTNDEVSFVPAQDIRDWCEHTGQTFSEWIKDGYLEQFSNMCVTDYVLANTDRHFLNWGFLVDNKTNDIRCFAPLYDHNQALVADQMGTDISVLDYEPIGRVESETPYLDAVLQYKDYATIRFDESKLSAACKERLRQLDLDRSRAKEI